MFISFRIGINLSFNSIQSSICLLSLKNSSILSLNCFIFKQELLKKNLSFPFLILLKLISNYKSRLDRIYGSKKITNLGNKCWTEKTILSDHNPIILEINFSKIKKGKNRFFFNNSYLNIKQFKDKLDNLFKDNKHIEDLIELKFKLIPILK